MTDHPTHQGKLSSHWTNAETWRFAKDVKSEGRSGNVYENKGEDDNLSGMKSDFSAQLSGEMWIMTIETPNGEAREREMSKMKVPPAISMKTNNGLRFEPRET